MEEAGLGVKDLVTLEYIEDARVCTRGEGRALSLLLTIMGCGPRKGNCRLILEEGGGG